MQEGTHIEEAVANIKAKGILQPVIISLGPERKPKQFFLCLDRIPINGGATVVEAFDKFLSLFFVFGLDYPRMLANFFEFFAAYIYEVLPTSRAKPMVRSFATAVKSVN